MNSDIVIDNKKLNNMLMRIISIERTNIRTKELKDVQMKEKIRKIIEEEIKCN